MNWFYEKGFAYIDEGHVKVLGCEHTTNLWIQALLLPLHPHIHALAGERKTPWLSWTSGASSERPADIRSLQNAPSLQFLQL